MKKIPSSGFTLVELMVSIGLFAIVMMLCAGAYFTIINLSRQAQGVSTAVDSVSSALEDMTRSMRTGTGYNCNSVAGGNCAGGGTSIFFTDQQAIATSYSRGTGVTCGTGGTGCLLKTTGTGVGAVTSVLTDPSINITSLTFYATGVATGDGLQPYVTMMVSGSILAGKTTYPFTIESSAVMRNTDL